MTTPITKLPDGSAFFTAVIMSKEEAIALPLKKRPLNFRISSEIYHKTFEQIGYASMCWVPKPSTEVFDSEKASGAAVELCFAIAEECEKGKWDALRVAMDIFSKRNDGQAVPVSEILEILKRESEKYHTP